MTLYKRRIILVICSLVFLAVTPFLLLYCLGYRLDRNFRIGRIGGLYISSPIPDAKIFVKGNLEKITNILQSGVFLQNLSENNYQILVEKEGYWPWVKNLNVKEGLVAEARAFLIPQTPQGKILLKGHFSAVWASPYNKILLLEEKNNSRRAIFYLPDSDTFLTPMSATTTKLLSFKNGVSKIFWEDGAVLLGDGEKTIKATFNLNNGTVNASVEPVNAIGINHKYEKFTSQKKERLWWNNETNEILFEWLGDKTAVPYYLCDTKPCESTVYLISNFAFPVKNAEFFPGRRDLLIAAVQNAVFALELDKRGGQLSRPIYKGKDPTFTVFPGEKKAYVLDEGVLIAVNLE
jgi:hypothetical protein